jgi:hypothetical protein
VEVYRDSVRVGFGLFERQAGAANNFPAYPLTSYAYRLARIDYVTGATTPLGTVRSPADGPLQLEVPRTDTPILYLRLTLPAASPEASE